MSATFVPFLPPFIPHYFTCRHNPHTHKLQNFPSVCSTKKTTPPPLPHPTMANKDLPPLSLYPRGQNGILVSLSQSSLRPFPSLPFPPSFLPRPPSLPLLPAATTIATTLQSNASPLLPLSFPLFPLQPKEKQQTSLLSLSLSAHTHTHVPTTDTKQHHGKTSNTSHRVVLFFVTALRRCHCASVV